MSQHSLLKRLSPYWKMEAANVVVVPAAMFILARGKLGWLTYAAIVPMMLLLIVGAVYWREKVLQLQSPAHDIAPALRKIGRARKPLLALTLAACLLAAAGWLAPGLAIGRADRIAATFAATLAALEYVNYYHRQLQHFDRWADFKRLLAGKGFRPSKMARDLRALGY